MSMSLYQYTRMALSLLCEEVGKTWLTFYIVQRRKMKKTLAHVIHNAVKAGIKLVKM